jgi:hypothetical protein
MPGAIATSGYSGTPLAAKLGLKDGMVAAFIALPAPLEALATAVSFTAVDRSSDWARLIGPVRRYDFIHAFTRQHDEIAENLADLQDAMKVDGMIWVSWPKKASKVATDVTEGVVRDEALKLDLVDVKVAAIDEIWSGLKLVIRKELRR